MQAFGDKFLMSWKDPVAIEKEKKRRKVHRAEGQVLSPEASQVGNIRLRDEGKYYCKKPDMCPVEQSSESTPESLSPVCTPTDKTYDKNQRTDQPAHS
jgi:hypothetical protein